MATEIERKFLVASPDWAEHAGPPAHLRQAYLANTAKAAIRVRIKGGDAAFLTIKSAEAGMSRLEVETAIPVAEAEQLLTLRQGAVIEKRRYKVPFGGLVWEIDVFEGENAGLVIAEVEIPSVDHPVAMPPWIGAEVTDDARYYNASLAEHPIRIA